MANGNFRVMTVFCMHFACSRIHNTMIGAAGRIAARRAPVPSAAVRRMSTAEPKMHKAKEWQIIKDSRPKTHDHVSSLVGGPDIIVAQMYHLLRTLLTEI